jgi:hypothetical protein
MIVHKIGPRGNSEMVKAIRLISTMTETIVRGAEVVPAGQPFAKGACHALMNAVSSVYAARRAFPIDSELDRALLEACCVAAEYSTLREE